MSVSELFLTRDRLPTGGLGGTMTGTMSGQQVSSPGLPGPQTGFASLGLQNAPPPDIQMPQPALADSPIRQSPPGFVPGEAAIGGQQFVQGLEQGAAGATSGVLNTLGAPVRFLMDVIGQLDRPQQFVFAALQKGLETGNVFEGLEAGMSAAIFRQPEPGGPKRRVEPGELINTVAREVFGVEDEFTRTMHPAARFASEFAVSVLVDPLIMFPGVWYSKAGTNIKKLTHALNFHDQARYAVTAGGEVAGAAAAARNAAITDAVRDMGKTEGPLGRVIIKASQDATDDEIAVIRDIATGIGIRGLDEELRVVFARAQQEGTEVSAQAVQGAMERATARMTESQVADLSEEISRVISHRRGVPDRAELFEVKVGGQKQYVTFESGMGDQFAEEALIGQLVNRGGLLPTEAMEKAGQVGDFLSGQVGGRLQTLEELGVKVAADGSMSTDLLTAWRGLGQTRRQKLLVRTDGTKRATSRTDFSSEEALRDALSPVEQANIVNSYLDKARKQALPAASSRLSRKQFVRRAIAGDGSLPKGASKRYEAALRASVGVGRMWVDAVSEARLRGIWMAHDLQNEAGQQMSRLAAGTLSPNVASDLPSAAANREVIRSMVDADRKATKDMHILWMLADPKTVLPEAMYARAKYGEDMYNAVQNAFGKEMDQLFHLDGAVIQEGSEMSRQLGLALYADEMEELVRKGGASEATQEFAAAATAAKTALKENDEAWQIYGSLKSVIGGFRESFIRRGFKEFAQGGIANYMARVYPRFKESVETAVRNGQLTPEEGAAMIRRGQKRDIQAALSPLEMDYVDGRHVSFRHLKKRSLNEPLPGLETDAVTLMRAYSQGAFRKIYLEPIVQDLDELGKGLPKWRKKYANLFLKRMLGFELLDEEILNGLVGQMNGMFGKAAELATFGRVSQDAKVFTAPRPATQLSLAVTRNFYRGLLGGNLGFMLKNFAQGINTATQAGPFEFMRGLSLFVTNPVIDGAGTRFRQLAANRNLARDLDQLMERGVYSGGFGGAAKRMVTKMDDLLFAPAKFSEFFNRGIALGAGMNQEMRKKGFKHLKEFAAKDPDGFAEAVQFGHAVANETQFIYGVVGRSPIAGSPIGRMGLQFFSWPIKQIAWLQQGYKDEGARFLLRYTAFSGMVSHMAAMAEVDASGFTGFGFVPSQAAPSVQAIANLNAAMVSAFVEDNEEEARVHFERFVKVVENLVPGMLQVQKTLEATASVATGEDRGTRERFARRTDDPLREQPLSQLLDVTINPINRALGLPELSGEQAARVMSLPDRQAAEFRKGIRRVEKGQREESRRYRRYIDDYVKALHTGEYTKAHEIKLDALKEGVFLSPEMIGREVMQKLTPTAARVSEGIRPAAKLRVGAEVFHENPELFRHMPGVIPLPPDALGGTR